MLPCNFAIEKDKGSDKAQIRKRCVAKGACRYGIAQILSGGSPIKVEKFANKTHSRFGIEALNEFNEIEFREIIGKRLKIPDESVGRVNVPLKRPKTIIPVIEHFGIGSALPPKETETIDIYSVAFMDEITDEDLKYGCIEMKVREDESIELIAKVKDKEFAFSSQRTVRY